MKNKTTQSSQTRKKKSSQWNLSIGSRYEIAAKRILLKPPPRRKLARQIAKAVVDEMVAALNSISPPWDKTTLEFLQAVQTTILAGTGQDDKTKDRNTTPDPNSAP